MLRALIVSPQNRAALAEILHDGGIEVLTAHDCSSACRQMESSTPVEIVLADVELPDGNWCTLLREFRERELTARLLVCIECSGGLRIVEVVQRGGEYALARSHDAAAVAELLNAA